MRLFYNDTLSNNYDILLEDQGLIDASNNWVNSDIIEKSAIHLPIFNTPLGSISILYGPRQIGKTASLKLFLTTVKDTQTIVFTDCSIILQKNDLYQHLKRVISGPTTIVLDEVQSIPDWHHALRAAYSEGLLKNCRIWCTGSEARHLLESGERLPGRKGQGKVIFARPWSFREYVQIFYPDIRPSLDPFRLAHINQKWLDDQKIDLSVAWSHYKICGGFPRCVAEFSKTKQISDSTYSLYTDWILGTWTELRTSERSLVALSSKMIRSLNSRVSYESLRSDTDIQSPNTVKKLIELQEDHFSVRSITRYDWHKERFLPTKLKKIYPLDPFIARIWNMIGKNIRRRFYEQEEQLALDECAFLTQTFRTEQSTDVGYLYSESTQSEIDFYFEGVAIELKSQGHPTPKQRKIMKECRSALTVSSAKLPIIAYLVGESRFG